jgi:hypothetical protein
VMSAADDSAVAATNCRRESFLRDMTFPFASFLSSCCSSSYSYWHSRDRADLDGMPRGDLIAQSEQN